MKKRLLISGPELFQGKKYLKKNKNYFEGWYFKNTVDSYGVSFIPGINITKDKKEAFIQVITKNTSYFINYDIEDFEFGLNPFFVRIGKNYFSKTGVALDIEDDYQNLRIYGNILFSNNENIVTNFLNPNIMGPFSYLPFMECNHAILSMKHKLMGSLNINNEIVVFDNGMGYIEKDWGTSFPKSYIWCQGNSFRNLTASFMFSVASIPLRLFQFEGFICVLIINGIEYKFATYNNSRIQRSDVDKEHIDIVLKKGHYYLNIVSYYGDGNKLVAPIKGEMIKEIFESISEEISITLKKNDEIIFSDTSVNCGLEIVRE